MSTSPLRAVVKLPSKWAARGSDYEMVKCDVCGQKIWRRKGKMLVHTSKMGTRYAHSIHVLRAAFGEKKSA